MKRLQNGVVVVELRQRGIQFDEEKVVNARVSDVMANCGDEQGEGIKGREERSNGGFRGAALYDRSMWRQRANMEKEAKN